MRAERQFPAIPHGIGLFVSPHADGSNWKHAATYDYERTAVLYARDYVAKGFRAWLKEGRVAWEITTPEPLCTP